jgi:hypothetical protein
MTFLETSIISRKIKFDPAKNSFPVTLHDPCNILINLGIQILNAFSKHPEP